MGRWHEGARRGSREGAGGHPQDDGRPLAHPAVPGRRARAAAALAWRDRPGRGELHGLHALRPGVPGLVHLHRLAQGRGPGPRRGAPPAAQRPGQVRHRLLPLHVLRDLHRGLPVRRALLVTRVRVRRVRHQGPAARQGPPGAVDGDRAAAPAHDPNGEPAKEETAAARKAATPPPGAAAPTTPPVRPQRPAAPPPPSAAP